MTDFGLEQVIASRDASTTKGMQTHPYCCASLSKRPQQLVVLFIDQMTVLCHTHVGELKTHEH